MVRAEYVRVGLRHVLDDLEFTTVHVTPRRDTPVAFGLYNKADMTGQGFFWS